MNGERQGAFPRPLPAAGALYFTCDLSDDGQRVRITPVCPHPPMDVSR